MKQIVHAIDKNPNDCIINFNIAIPYVLNTLISIYLNSDLFYKFDLP